MTHSSFAQSKIYRINLNERMGFALIGMPAEMIGNLNLNKSFASIYELLDAGLGSFSIMYH